MPGVESVPKEPHPTKVAVNDTGGGPSADLRVFAGLRSDPFFMDIPGYLATVVVQ